MSFETDFSGSSLFPSPNLVDFEVNRGDTTSDDDAFCKEISYMANYGWNRTGSTPKDSRQRKDGMGDLDEPYKCISLSPSSSLDATSRKDSDLNASGSPSNIWIGYAGAEEDTVCTLDASPPPAGLESTPRATTSNGFFTPAPGNSVHTLQMSEDVSDALTTDDEPVLEEAYDDAVYNDHDAVQPVFEVSEDNEDEGSWEFSSASTADSEEDDLQESTPDLSETWSASLSPATIPLTPRNDLSGSQDSLDASRDVPARRKRFFTQEKAVSTKKPVRTSSRAAGKRKRPAGDNEVLEDQGRQDRNGLLPAKKLSKLFEIQFLLWRFDFAGSQKKSKCPFRRTAHRSSDCRKDWNAAELSHHIRGHCTTFGAQHPGEALDCPLKGKDGCKWRNENAKDVTWINPNDGLPRHILDGHFKSRSSRCPCGGVVTRTTRDQVVRHLVTAEHREKLGAVMREHPHLVYPDIRDPLLLDEQQAWKDGRRERCDDKEEGSSKGRKRARRL